MRRTTQFRPVGHGLDAIVFPAAHPRTWWEKLCGLRARPDDELLRPAPDADRLDRYRDAALLRPMYRDPHLLDLRELRGWNYLKAWRIGWFPKVSRLKRAHLALVRKQATPARAAAGRG